METSEIENASLDDIIFEGRNKAYGAYMLRKLYNRHLAMATALAISLFVLFSSIPLIANFSKDEIIIVAPPKPNHTGHTISELVLPPKPEPGPAQPVEKPASQQTSTTTRYVPYKVLRDDKVTQPDDNPDVAELKGTEVGATTQLGDPDGLADLLADLGPGTGTGPTGTTGSGTGQEVFIQVEQMPEFEGSLSTFLQKNIRYPQEAQRLNREGLVVLTFIVNRNGEITDIEILKGLGAGLDEEAIRVVKKMPRWKPGRQNGQAVPVRFTLPFRFAIN